MVYSSSRNLSDINSILVDCSISLFGFDLFNKWKLLSLIKLKSFHLIWFSIFSFFSIYTSLTFESISFSGFIFPLSNISFISEGLVIHKCFS